MERLADPSLRERRCSLLKPARYCHKLLQDGALYRRSLRVMMLVFAATQPCAYTARSALTARSTRQATMMGLSKEDEMLTMGPGDTLC